MFSSSVDHGQVGDMEVVADKRYCKPAETTAAFQSWNATSPSRSSPVTSSLIADPLPTLLGKLWAPIPSECNVMLTGRVLSLNQNSTLETVNGDRSNGDDVLRRVGDIRVVSGMLSGISISSGAVVLRSQVSTENHGGLYRPTATRSFASVVAPPPIDNNLAGSNDGDVPYITNPFCPSVNVETNNGKRADQLVTIFLPLISQGTLPLSTKS